MKNLLKTFRIELAVAVVLSALLIFAFNKPAQKAESVRTIRQLITDSTKTVEAKAVIARKDSVIRVLWSQVLSTKSGLARQKELNRGLKTVSDTMQARYNRNRTLQSCDSTLTAKDNEISGLEIENDSLTSEAIGYSKLLAETTDKYKVAESLLVTKQQTIDLQSAEINRLCCARNWGFKHKFWKWVFHFRCE